jgi:membrane protein implicated in regulation of membrane protease activity
MMAALTTVYWLCFGFGLVYVVISAALGAISHGLAGGGGQDVDASGHSFEAAGHSFEAAGHDVDAGGVDADADGGELASADLSTDDAAGTAGYAEGAGHADHVGHGAQYDTHVMPSFSPFSPLSVAGFLAAFGGAGLAASEMALPPLATLGIAAGGGLAMGYLLYLLIGKLLFSMQGSSEAHQADMLGLEAEVLTPVEHELSGEIAYVLQGTRYTAPARLVRAGRIEKREFVRIKEIKDNIVYVEPKRKLLE